MIQIVLGAFAVTALFALWVTVGAVQRRNHPEMEQDADVLRCAMCGPEGQCGCGLRAALGSRSTREDENER